MKRFCFLLFSFFLLTAKLSAQQGDTTSTSINGSDLLALDDGSFLRGHVIEKSSGMMKFHDNTVGDVTLRSSHVKWLVHIETGTTYRVATNNASYLGKLVAADNRGLQIETSVMGRISVPYTSIEQISQAGAGSKQHDLLATVDETPESGDPFYTHYFILPSAIPVRSDELSYRNTELGINSLHYSINDHASIYGGLAGFIAPYFGVRGGWKVGEQSYIGGTILGGGLIVGFGGSVYGIGGLATYTYGNEVRNISAGIAYGFGGGGGDLVSPEQPLYTLSGMIRAGRRAMFLSENWFVPGISGNGSNVIHYDSFHLLGLRVVAGKRAWDMGLLTSPLFWQNRIGIGLIPVVSYSLKF